MQTWSISNQLYRRCGFKQIDDMTGQTLTDHFRAILTMAHGEPMKLLVSQTDIQTKLYYVYLLCISHFLTFELLIWLSDFEKHVNCYMVDFNAYNV